MMKAIDREAGQVRGQILVVDGDTEILKDVEALLGDAGYKPTSVTSFTRGLRLAMEARFDLILLDWNVEGGLGIDLCREIRTFDYETPIFFYTRLPARSNVTEAIAAGAQGCFIDPSDVRDIQSAILSRLGEARMTGKEQ